jgi:hypothetical protein
MPVMCNQLLKTKQTVIEYVLISLLMLGAIALFAFAVVVVFTLSHKPARSRGDVSTVEEPADSSAGSPRG